MNYAEFLFLSFLTFSRKKMNKEQILKYGLMVFNNETDKFERWLEKENVSLENYSPKELIETEDGRIQVKYILDMLEYGIFN